MAVYSWMSTKLSHLQAATPLPAQTTDRQTPITTILLSLVSKVLHNRPSGRLMPLPFVRFLLLSALFCFFSPLAGQNGPAGCPISQHCALLQWMDTLNPSGTTYNAYRMSGVCPPSQPVSTSGFTELNGSPVVSMTYTDMTVTGGGIYCYVVTAVYMGVESAPSSDVQASIPNVGFVCSGCLIGGGTIH